MGSFAAESGLAHVPVLNKNKALVPSKTPKLPVVSSKSFVSVFSCFNNISGLPNHIEYIYREDLTLSVLKQILEYDLERLP